MLRRSVIADVVEKQGRTGALLFVNVDHEILTDGQLMLTERQSIVYREHPTADAPTPAPQTALDSPQWKTKIYPDPVLLFRYSALTFNCHRIHYDRPYATDVEGYPGLVVHAPLIATILLHTFLSQHPGSSVARYTFRALRPLFDTAPFFACGSLNNDGVAHLFACDQSGNLCTSATAILR
jgi:3-methylfumaryl-CoA hydratase